MVDSYINELLHLVLYVYCICYFCLGLARAIIVRKKKKESKQKLITKWKRLSFFFLSGCHYVCFGSKLFNYRKT